MPAPRPRAGILEIQPYVGGKGHALADDVIKLSANESALGPSPKAMAAYRDLAAKLHRYPDGSSHDLRHAIGARYDLDPAAIVCGAGSDELITFLIQAYAGPGDEVLYSAHGFLMYKLTALAFGATPVAAPERVLTADVDALLAAVTSRTRLVFLANPNNPTGSYLSPAELKRLRDGLPDDVLLVIDAAYAEFVRRNDYDDGAAMVAAHDNVVMTRTFSKLHGLAALRLGWLYGPPAVVDVLNRVRGPFNVNLPAQLAGVAALADLAHQEAALAHNDHWLPWLAEEIRGLGLNVHPSAGNFLLVDFPQSPGRDAKAAAQALEARGVLVRPMGGYGLPHALRISIGLEAENRACVDALADFLR